MIDDNLPSQKHNSWHCCDLQPQGPRSRAFYYSRNSLLHTWIIYYTELPMKVPITPHHLENRYYAPPPIAITGNHLTRLHLYYNCPLRGCDTQWAVDLRGRGMRAWCWLVVWIPVGSQGGEDEWKFIVIVLRRCALIIRGHVNNSWL